VLVLVVEDEPMIAASIEWELLDAGYDVLGPAGCVAEAEALAAASRPDLALIDINLAGHDEGVSLARTLKSRQGVPCVFVTGQVTQARQASDAALGVLTKPFNFRSLVETVPVAAALAEGRRPTRLPRGLEVFGDCSIAQAS
jgi:DNA-binding response OmpR family regulator